MAESIKYPLEFVTVLAKLLGTDTSNLTPDEIYRIMKFTPITMSSVTDASKLLGYETSGSEPSPSNPGIFVVFIGQGAILNTWIKADNTETKKTAFFVDASPSQYTFWKYEDKWVKMADVPKTDYSQLDPAFVFIVADHHTYQTIQVNNYYVTFNPHNLKDNLPARKTNVGQYEKFIFTPVSSIQ